jgi:hypothetical protein
VAAIPPSQGRIRRKEVVRAMRPLLTAMRRVEPPTFSLRKNSNEEGGGHPHISEENKKEVVSVTRPFLKEE